MASGSSPQELKCERKAEIQVKCKLLLLCFEMKIFTQKRKVWCELLVWLVIYLLPSVRTCICILLIVQCELRIYS